MEHNGKLRKLAVTAEQLKSMVVDQMLPHRETARILGVAECTIHAWCRRFGIERTIRQAPPPLVKMTVSEEEFREMVVAKKMTDIAIAKQLGVCNVTVMNWRQRFGLLSRYANRRSNRASFRSKPARKFFLEKDELVRLYHVERLTQSQIASKSGVTQGAVSLALSGYGIHIRPRGSGTKIFLDEDSLRRLYIDQEMTALEIAAQLGCGESVVRNHLVGYGLQIGQGTIAERRLKRNQERYTHRSEHRGYVLIRMPNHPFADNNGNIAQHRVVAEKAMGRTLRVGEKVHHINLQKRDNAAANLAVLPTVADHSRVHKYMERVAAYLCGLTSIMPEPLSFGEPVFWGGRYVKTLDLIQCARMNALQPALPVAERDVAETVN